jgi:hypothetical protein
MPGQRASVTRRCVEMCVHVRCDTHNCYIYIILLAGHLFQARSHHAHSKNRSSTSDLFDRFTWYSSFHTKKNACTAR